jgi:hypothetical protein
MLTPPRARSKSFKERSAFSVQLSAKLVFAFFAFSSRLLRLTEYSPNAKAAKYTKVLS